MAVQHRLFVEDVSGLLVELGDDLDAQFDYLGRYKESDPVAVPPPTF